MVSGFGDFYRINPQGGQSLGGLSFCLCQYFVSIIAPVNIFFPFLEKPKHPHFGPLLELHVVCELYLVYSELLG